MLILALLAYGPTLYLNYLDDTHSRILNFPSEKLKTSIRDRMSSLRRSFHHWGYFIDKKKKNIFI